VATGGGSQRPSLRAVRSPFTQPDADLDDRRERAESASVRSSRTNVLSTWRRTTVSDARARYWGHSTKRWTASHVQTAASSVSIAARVPQRRSSSS
jgi:hypothetical protein